MKIRTILNREAPNSSTHDINYRRTLRAAYLLYKDMDLNDLKKHQTVARANFDSTHASTAQCVILYELIKEKENEQRGIK